jgi:hypothetical protein
MIQLKHLKRFYPLARLRGTLFYGSFYGRANF